MWEGTCTYITLHKESHVSNNVPQWVACPLPRQCGRLDHHWSVTQLIHPL
ncbi:hypothetical protein [Bacteriophage sp.]|nr:hypothetical protein [Bacteriophage sp.]UOF80114.1 hypothetical protein [Bacteriophage sp.]